jgi:hypothetical protein
MSRPLLFSGITDIIRETCLLHPCRMVLMRWHYRWDLMYSACLPHARLQVCADDLELLVRHPLGLAAQAAELLSVWQLGGQQALADHRVDPPAWEEVQALAELHNLSKRAHLQLSNIPHLQLRGAGTVSNSSTASAGFPQLAAPMPGLVPSKPSGPGEGAATTPGASDAAGSDLTQSIITSQVEHGHQQALELQPYQRQSGTGRGAPEGLPLGWHMGQGERSDDDDDGDYDQSDLSEDEECDVQHGMLATSNAAGTSSVRRLLAVAACGAAACSDAQEAAQLLLQGAGLLPVTRTQFHQQLLPGAEPEQALSLGMFESSAAAGSSPCAVDVQGLHGGDQAPAPDCSMTPAAVHLAGAHSNPPPHQTSSSGQHRGPGQHRMVHRAELVKLAAQAAGLR